MAKGKHFRGGNGNRIVRVHNDKLNGVVWMMADACRLNYQEAYDIIMDALMRDDRAAAVVLDEIYDSYK